MGGEGAAEDGVIRQRHRLGWREFEQAPGGGGRAGL